MQTITLNSIQSLDSDPQLANELRENPVRRGPVLLATDGTDATGAAAVAARRLATHLGVPLEVVTILEPLVVYGGSVELGIGLPPDAESEAAYRGARESRVRDYVTHFTGEQPARVHARYGAVAREIAEAARELSATLVVVGAAVHRRIRHSVAGERAVHVLRGTDCPVLSVQSGFSVPARHVVVAVDFGPSSIRAAHAALLLLGEWGTLTLVHVVQPIEFEAGVRTGTGREQDEALRSMFVRLRAELQPYLSPAIEIETKIVEGAVIEELFRRADIAEADLVVVGTHGPGLVERLLAGSVATGVLHAADRTVLAVPPPAPAEALRLRMRMLGTVAWESPTDWSEALDRFTSRNVGRGARLEIDDPEIGARVEGKGFRLIGALYDAHERCLELMLGDVERPLHLARSISRPMTVAVSTAPDGRDEALEIRHAGGHTLLLLDPA